MNEIAGAYFLLVNELISTEEFDLQFLSIGINVYEVLRFVDITPLFFHEHFSRFVKSVEGKMLDHNLNPESLLKKIQKLRRANSESFGNIKIVVHSENNTSNIIYIYQTPHFYPSENDYRLGVKMVSLNEGRPDPNYKTWRPIFKETISSLKKDFNAYDILLVDNGLIREASQSNFFAINNNKIITAPGDSVLKGITREIIFHICNKENISIEEADFSLADLKKAEAIFLTGTSPGILPVSQIDNLRFPPSHSILQILLKQYKEIINQHIKKLQ